MVTNRMAEMKHQPLTESARLSHASKRSHMRKVGTISIALLLLIWALLGVFGAPLQPEPAISYALADPETKTFQYGYLGYTDTVDTYINRWFPDTNYGWYNTMSVRAGDYVASLIYFDVSSIPSFANVISATLQLWCTGTGGHTVNIDAYRILRPWNEMQATWNVAKTGIPWGLPGCNDTATDRLPVSDDQVTVLADNTWYFWDVTPMVQAWVANSVENQGMALKGSGDHFVQFAFATREYWDAVKRPILKVRYSLGPIPTGTATATQTPIPSATATSTSWLTFTPTRTPTRTPTGTITPITPTPTQTTGPGDVEIQIVPDVKMAYTNEIFTLDIMIHAPTQPVDSVAAYIDFDPAFLRVVDEFGTPTNQIVPDPTMPIVLTNHADNGLGDIDYIAGAPLPPAPPPSGYFRVATIRFKALAENMAGTPVTFSFGPPRRTITLFEGWINLGSHVNGIVFISAATRTPTATATRTITSTPTRTATPPGPTPGAVTLYIDPSPKNVNVNDIFTVDIKVNASSQTVDSGAVYVDFDPAYLRVVDASGNPLTSIIPVSPFTSVFENVANNAFGTINYQAGIPLAEPDCNSVCTVATIRFKALAPTAGTPLIFHTSVPRRTRMVFGGYDQSTTTLHGNVIIGGAPGPTSTPTATRTATPTTTASPPAGVSIVLDPGLKIAFVGEVFDLDVIINAGSQPLDGAQVYVNFAPAYLQVLSVIPDLTAFPDIVSGPAWDNVAGHVDYVAGRLSGTLPTGSFRVATIRFSGIAPVGGTLVQFAYHPPSRDTKVTYQALEWRPTGVSSIILINPSGGATPTITKTPTRTATPTQTPTPTATVPTGPSGTVTGRVILEGRTNHSGATVTVGGRSAVTAADGTFTVTNVPVGLHTARASKQSYLYAEKADVLVTNGGVTNLPDVGLYGGDCTGDGIADVYDMVIVGMAYEATPGDPHWNPTADINGDNLVDIVDLMMIGINYEKTAPTAWTMF